MEHRDLLDRLVATPRTLAHLVAEVSDARLDASAPREWPVRTILAHLRDDEYLVMRTRLERMLAERHPVFPDFDEKAWAAARNRSRDRKQQLLGDFALQRQASLNILEALEPADWVRTGRHEVYGEFSVASWVEHWAQHDAAHVAQVEAALGETLSEVLARRSRTLDRSEDAANQPG